MLINLLITMQTRLHSEMPCLQGSFPSLQMTLLCFNMLSFELDSPLSTLIILSFEPNTTPYPSRPDRPSPLYSFESTTTPHIVPIRPVTTQSNSTSTTYNSY